MHKSSPHVNSSVQAFVSTPTRTLCNMKNTGGSSAFIRGAPLAAYTQTHTQPGMLKYGGNLQQATGGISQSP